jgi:hypothetical protein
MQSGIPQVGINGYCATIKAFTKAHRQVCSHCRFALSGKSAGDQDRLQFTPGGGRIEPRAQQLDALAREVYSGVVSEDKRTPTLPGSGGYLQKPVRRHRLGPAKATPS